MSNAYYGPPKCKCCGRTMLAGLVTPGICRNCVSEGIATDPTYCSHCKGDGTVGTGIDESPTTLCDACDGTGLSVAARLYPPRYVP